MKKGRVWTALGLGMVLFLCVQTAHAEKGYTGPNDPAAVKAAKEAVKRLEPDHGAIPIHGSSVGIVGLQSAQIKRQKNTGIKGLSVEVNKILTDLGAKKVGEKIQVSLSGDVLFDFDKWDIKLEAEKILYKLVKAIKGLNVKEILIEGYTDSKGSDKYNLALSQRRAEAVKTWLVKKGGLEDAKIVTKGRGKANPVAPNTNPDGSDNPKGRAKNRRVEIFVTLVEE